MIDALASALFPGYVTHVRERPHRHTLGYRIYSLLIDLDELGALGKQYRLLSVDRFNLFSFYTKDRGDGTGLDLKGQVERALAAAGLIPDGGPIRLLTMPRVLGLAFNPLSIYFCFRRTGEIAAILYEVDNTFGERHGYLLAVEGAGTREICQTCPKGFFVSPFMDMDLTYTFRVRPPGPAFSVVIEVSDGEGTLLTARHLGRRVELSDGALLRAFVAIPLLAVKVVGGIVWEALKIWLKGVQVRAHPTASLNPVSIVARSKSTKVQAP
jgi:uncharacterized protein